MVAALNGKYCHFHVGFLEQFRLFQRMISFGLATEAQVCSFELYYLLYSTFIVFVYMYFVKSFPKNIFEYINGKNNFTENDVSRRLIWFLILDVACVSWFLCLHFWHEPMQINKFEAGLGKHYFTVVMSYFLLFSVLVALTVSLWRNRKTLVQTPAGEASRSVGDRAAKSRLGSLRGLSLLAAFAAVATAAAIGTRSILLRPGAASPCADAQLADWDVISKCTETIRLSPSSEAYRTRTRPMRAWVSLTRRSRMAPPRSRSRLVPSAAYVDRGNAYWSKGDAVLALSDFNDAIRIDRTAAAALVGRGLVLSARGDFSAALADFSDAIKIDADFAAYNDRAGIYARMGEFERAITDYEEALRLKRELVETRTNLGRLYMRTGDAARAAAAFEEALHYEPKLLQSLPPAAWPISPRKNSIAPSTLSTSPYGDSPTCRLLI